ncbi:hypothetical protein DERF_010832 [Dermatophagoides farinae]|uniref:Uncharacterized protein n=1 Tax=Dermatophagoides farinae TaxID=6954 RepID=A0A922HRP5_DERFA|nr:hypothetical protein DERF_010832 [Dermatophagoides farinae]
MQCTTNELSGNTGRVTWKMNITFHLPWKNTTSELVESFDRPVCSLLDCGRADAGAENECGDVDEVPVPGSDDCCSCGGGVEKINELVCCCGIDFIADDDDLFFVFFFFLSCCCFDDFEDFIIVSGFDDVNDVVFILIDDSNDVGDTIICDFFNSGSSSGRIVAITNRGLEFECDDDGSIESIDLDDGNSLSLSSGLLLVVAIVVCCRIK